MGRLGLRAEKEVGEPRSSGQPRPATPHAVCNVRMAWEPMGQSRANVLTGQSAGFLGGVCVKTGVGAGMGEGAAAGSPQPWVSRVSWGNTQALKHMGWGWGAGLQPHTGLKPPPPPCS